MVLKIVALYYPVKSSKFLDRLFPNLVWRKGEEKVIYLTFDDGPTPEITDWTLDILKQYNAKGTFFVLGKNVEAEGLIYQRLLDEGHTVGNHTQNHKNGWITKLNEYVADIEKAAEVIDSKLFRPPYGKLRPRQAKWLVKNGYTPIMWTVMPGDFDQTISSEQCWQNIKNNTSEGSIIVMHDSVKASQHLKYILPKTLAHFSELGYEFKAL